MKWQKLQQVRQQDAYPTNAGVQLKHPPPHFKGTIFRRSLYASIYSTQGIENDLSARIPNTSSTSCDLDLWLPDPPRLTVHALAQGGEFMSIYIEIGIFRFEV